MKLSNIKKTIPNKWLIIPIILFTIYFIIRLLDQSKLIYIFPLDTANDISSYMAILFFFIKCGYNQIVPYWYNGYLLFRSFPPGFFFFALPIYYIVKNIQLTMYISMVAIFLSIFLIFFILRNKLKLSKIKAIFLFLILFANPISIGNFIRLGRLPELFGWLWFTIMFVLVVYYKNKKLDKYFIIFIIAYAWLLISHPSVAMVGSFLPLSLFLVKSIKEKIYIIISVLASFLFASFWIIPFILKFSKTSVSENPFTYQLIEFLGQWFLTNLVALILPLTLLIVFYYYWLSKYKSKKELLFFIPIFLINFILLTRLVIFVPFLKTVFPDVYIIFLLFFTVYYFLKLKLFVLRKLKRIIPLVLLVLAIISITVSVIHTPFFVKYTETEYNMLEILNETTQKFIILGKSSRTSYKKAYYSYAPIHLNLSTPDGWSDEEISESYLKDLLLVNKKFEKKDCIGLSNTLRKLNTLQVISYKEGCKTLKGCKFKEVNIKNNICLYKLK